MNLKKLNQSKSVTVISFILFMLIATLGQAILISGDYLGIIFIFLGYVMIPIQTYRIFWGKKKNG